MKMEFIRVLLDRIFEYGNDLFVDLYPILIKQIVFLFILSKSQLHRIMYFVLHQSALVLNRQEYLIVYLDYALTVMVMI